MAATELLLIVLAVWEILELWNHGSIFATLRVGLNESDSKIAELLRCMLCLAPWVSLLLVSWLTALPWGVARDGWPPWVAPVSWVLVQALAVARLANLASDVTHGICRSKP